jgi:hypothetical protein
MAWVAKYGLEADTMAVCSGQLSRIDREELADLANRHHVLALLDEVFGPDAKVKSSFRKVRQTYDERTDEHVVLIEYRARKKGAVRTTPKGWQKSPSGNLLRQLNARAKQA